MQFCISGRGYSLGTLEAERGVEAATATGAPLFPLKIPGKTEPTSLFLSALCIFDFILSSKKLLIYVACMLLVPPTWIRSLLVSYCCVVRILSLI